MVYVLNPSIHTFIHPSIHLIEETGIELISIHNNGLNVFMFVEMPALSEYLRGQPLNEQIFPFIHQKYTYYGILRELSTFEYLFQLSKDDDFIEVYRI